MLLPVSVVYAQQKISDGTASATINSNALLELQSTQKGLLLPRVALTSTTSPAPMPTHVQGMAVYNTATAGSGTTAVTPGYYYNNGSGWVRGAFDNLGNHTATQNLNLTSYSLVGNSGSLGIKIASDGLTRVENLPDYTYGVDSFMVLGNKSGDLKRISIGDFVTLLKADYGITPNIIPVKEVRYRTLHSPISDPQDYLSASVLRDVDRISLSDGDLSTFMTAMENDYAFFLFDLGVAKHISSITFSPSQYGFTSSSVFVSATYPNCFYLFGSDNGTSWTGCSVSMGPSSTSSNTTTTTLYVDASANYRYYALRLNLHSSDHDLDYISELSLNP